MLRQPPIPKIVRLEEVKAHCTIFGKEKIKNLIRAKEIRGGRLPAEQNKTEPWFVDLHSLLAYIDQWMNDTPSDIQKKLDEYFSRNKDVA